MEMYKLVSEIFDDFQLPPYLSEKVVERACNECIARLSSLNPSADFENDSQSRMLLKNAVYYMVNHRYEEFESNYADVILSWQLGAVSNLTDTSSTSEDSTS